MLTPSVSPTIFSLEPNDLRIFIYVGDFLDRLQPEFLEWLELFVGKVREADGQSVTGDGWEYREITTTGVLDLNLSFDDPKHGAMFKLIWGYDVV